MKRPLFYVLSLIFHASFWLVLLLANYSDYTGSAPEVLQKDYSELFEANRLSLVLAELFFPFLMVVASLILILVKFRPRPIRLPYMLLLLMGLEFWLWRTFFFPDRMATYYAMSDLKINPENAQEGHYVLLIAYLIFGMLIFLIKEYSQPEGITLTEIDKRTITRTKPPWERND
ncbi:MAG TPA: hypothetical protein ENJ82_09005 [Bacteroidetes bacterium]|nr:hypothetical protein [Bacteroidota bacterium]